MEKICLGCMQMKQSVPVCEHCGFDERMENLPHQLPMGTILQNQYLVGRVLGQGGFGITYIGWDQHLSIPVAIKEYFPGGVVQRNTRWSSEVMCATGEAPELFEKHKTKFLKEARTLAQLSGIPEIVQIKSFFPENGTAYIVMEYVQGITLKDHLKKLGRPLSESEALAIMEPVLKALQKVHDQGLIHRDVSPDNIMLPKSGGVKLIDFGTVRYMDDSGKSKSTEAVLKPGFAPMEQYNSRGNLGTWTDVYAVSATFHYLLTGKVPADVHTRLDETDDLTMLKNRPGLSPRTVSILEKGMKLRTQERIQTVRELYQLLYDKGKKAPVTKHPKESSQVTPRKPKGKKRLLAACAAAAVAIGAAAILLISPAQKPLPSPTEKPAESTTVPDTPLSPEEQSYREAEAMEAAGQHGGAAIAFGKLGDYADSRERSRKLWAEISGRQTVLLIDNGNISSAIGIRQDGTIQISESSVFGNLPIFECVGWSDVISLCGDISGVVGLRSDGRVLSECHNVSSGIDTSAWNDIVAVYYLNYAVIGQKADGTLVVTGEDRFGLSQIAQWTDIVKLYPSYRYTVGLKADGTIVIAGENNYSLNFTDFDYTQWTDIVKVCSSQRNIVALRSDGTVVAAGDNEHGQCDVSQWSDIADVAMGGGFDLGRFTVGLKKDGTVVTAGYVENSWDLDSLTQWTDITAISASSLNVVGLKSDGTLVGGGREFYNSMDFADWTEITQILTGSYETRALRADGTVLSAGNNLYGQCDTADWYDIQPPLSFGACFQSDGTVMVADRRWRELTKDWTGMMLPMEGYDQIIPCPAAAVSHDAEPEQMPDVRAAAYTEAESLLSNGDTARAAIAFGKLAGYKDARERSFALWDQVAQRDAVCVYSVNVECEGVTYAARDDGSVLFTGGFYGTNSGKALTQDILTNGLGWTDIIAVTDGLRGLRADGTVVRKYTESWEGYVPDCLGWENIVAISGELGLNMDGTVVVDSDAYYLNEEKLAEISQWKNIVAVCGGWPSVGLTADGTVVITEDANSVDVSQWQNISAVCTGSGFVVGLKSDGTVIATGSNRSGQCNVSQWTDIVAIAAGNEHTVGLKKDGTVVATGKNLDGCCNVAGWTDVVAVYADSYHTLALKEDGTLVATGSNNFGQCNVSHWTNIRLPK